MPGENRTAYRAGAALALAAAFLIVWLNLVAGLLGLRDDDPANLLYACVLAIAAIGAIVARLRPRGLSRAMIVTASALMIVGVFALTYPNTASPVQIALLHGLFVVLFGGAALAFRFADRPSVAA